MVCRRQHSLRETLESIDVAPLEMNETDKLTKDVRVPKFWPRLLCYRFIHESIEKSSKSNFFANHLWSKALRSVGLPAYHFATHLSAWHYATLLWLQNFESNLGLVPNSSINLTAIISRLVRFAIIWNVWTDNPPDPIGSPNSTSNDVIVQLSMWACCWLVETR